MADSPPKPATATDRPPGPAPLPIVGNLVAYASDPLGFLEDTRTYGDIAQTEVMGVVYWQLHDPAHIETVLVRERERFRKDQGYERLKSLMGDGLISSEGEVWKRSRKLVSRPFAKKHVDGYAAQMRDIVDRNARLATGERDVYLDMNKLTEEIVLEILFGVPAESAGHEVEPAIRTWMEQWMAEESTLLRAVPKWVPTPGRRRAVQSVGTLDEVLGRIIAEKRAAGAPGEDVLSRLIHAGDEDGDGLDDAQLRDECITLFVAGHETTALALTWALFLLADHPQWQERIRAEVVAALPDGPRTADDVRGLPVTEAVLKEAMRLYPPAWVIGREPLEDVELGGYVCKKGTQLVISPWLQHRDPRWFPEPTRFDPERWLNGSCDDLHRFQYMPFGGGPRVCVGNHFAMMEAIIALAVLLRERSVERTDAPGPEPMVSLTLRPDRPVMLRYVDVAQ